MPSRRKKQHHHSAGSRSAGSALKERDFETIRLVNKALEEKVRLREAVQSLAWGMSQAQQG